MSLVEETVQLKKIQGRVLRVHVSGALVPLQFGSLPRYVRTALNQREACSVIYFPDEDTYGDVLDDPA